MRPAKSLCNRKSMNPVSEIDFARNLSMPAAAKTLSEATTGASARIGGLLSAHRSAPSAGVKVGPILKRVDSL